MSRIIVTTNAIEQRDALALLDPMQPLDPLVQATCSLS